MLSLFAFAITYCAYTFLCLAMPKHFRQVTGDHSMSIGNHWFLFFRCCGWLLIAFSLILCIDAAGWQLGPVQWVGMLVVAGILLVLLLPYKPKTAVGLAIIAPLVSIFIFSIERFYP